MAPWSEERLVLELGGFALDAALVMPPQARGGVALAHGRVDDLDHPSLMAVARGAAQAGWACVRCNFPYRQQSRREPDAFETLVRVHLALAGWLMGRLPAESRRLVLAGKSQGSRTALAASRRIEAAGLILLGYPLHPARERHIRPDEPLAQVGLPLLVVQGTRDPLARPGLLEPLLERLPGPMERLFIAQGSHAFAVPHGPKAQAAVWQDIAQATEGFLAGSARISHGGCAALDNN